jgi:hypothetical protein
MAFDPKLISDESEPTLQQDGRIVRTHRRMYRCTHDFVVSNLQVLALLGVAQGDTHPDDPLATLVSAPVKRKDVIATGGARPMWEVTLNYSTDAPAIVSQNSDDPTQLRVKRWWSTTEEQRYIIKDRNGLLIVNTAKVPPAGGIPVNIELPVLVYERNEADFSGATATLWSGSINISAFSGAAPKTLKLKVTGEEQYEAKSHFWRVRYEMVYDENGWNPRWVNAGTHEWDPINQKLIPCLDELLQPVTEPVPLDSMGQQIDPSLLPDAAIINEVDYRRLREFQLLGLSEV